jgi:hypothetical protein
MTAAVASPLSIMTTEAAYSVPIIPRANGWYRQGSSTALLDPVVGADNNDDDGEQKLQELERSLTINCLHRGSSLYHARRKFMVAVDGTLASRRALTAALKLMTNPDDHIILVHIWEPASPLEFGALVRMQTFHEHVQQLLSHLPVSSCADFFPRPGRRLATPS